MAPVNSSQRQLVALFLVKFEVRKGNTIVWSRKDPNANVIIGNGLEFKAMPSGLHTKKRDVVVFSVPDKDKTKNYRGVAVYRQSVGRVLMTGVDRDSVAMYSLGILLSSDAESSPDSDKHWVFIKDMDKLLVDFMDSTAANKDLDKNPSHVYQEFDKFFDTHGMLSLVDPYPNHPLHDTVDFIKQYGPNIFYLWRQCLLRRRVLMVDKSGPENGFASYANYVFILSLLASIPKDVRDTIPHASVNEIPVNSVYNVTLVDIAMLKDAPGYIATTSDEILLEKPQLFDVAIVTDNYGRCELQEPIISQSLEETIEVVRSTHNDASRYEFLIKALNIEEAPPADYFEAGNKWINRIRSVCNEDTVYGLLWWAAAGSPAGIELENGPQGLRLIESWNINEEEGDQQLFESEGDDDPDTSRVSRASQHQQQVNIPVSVIGYFHYLTRRLFSTIGGLIRVQNQADMLSHTPDYALSTLLAENSASPIVIDPIDMTHMGLDPLSFHDRQFLTQFIATWWGRRAVINTISLTSCCC